MPFERARFKVSEIMDLDHPMIDRRLEHARRDSMRTFIDVHTMSYDYVLYSRTLIVRTPWFQRQAG